MLKSEKQLTNNATRVAIEEAYMSVDLPTNAVYDSHTGYRFNYPQRWLRDRSEKKMIGIRRFTIKPFAGLTLINLDVYDDSGTNVCAGRTVLEITEDNLLEEMLCQMTNEFAVMTGTNGDSYIFGHTHSDNDVKFYVTNTTDSKTTYASSGDFYFTLDGVSVDDTVNFLKFMNYPDADNTTTIPNSFTDVWNRRTLYCHSTFSSSVHNYVCKSCDFWDKPSKFYDYTTNDNDFCFWFTTDGKTVLLPRYSPFIVEICFIINYDTSLALT